MKRKKLLYLFLVATVAYGCSSGDRSSEVREINLDPESRQIGKLTLNELVESISYIPLETTDDCLIGEITNSIISENHLLLYCRIARRCYLFNKTGRFVAPIGNFGQGPGEYSYGPELIQIDEKNNEVILRTSNPNQLLYYDFNGKYKKSESLDITSGNLSYHTNFYLIKTRNDGSVPYSYTILDKDFKMVAQTIQPIHFTPNPPGTSAGGGVVFCQYMYDNKVHVRENMLNDTLYMINSDFSVIPKYVVNAGTYGVTLEIRSDTELFISKFRSGQITILSSMFETNDYVLLSFRYLQEMNIPSYYNKKEDKFLYFSSSAGIPNDYDGGLDFWPQYQYNNQLIAYYQAYKFEEHLNSSNKLKPQGTLEVINYFDQMCRKIDTEDNPVMVVVTLKN